MEFTIQPNAYYKCLLHCAKFPTRAVNGVFVGRYNPKSKVVEVEDCFPLLHLTVGLLPLLEAGLLMVEELCKKKKLEVVGYYFCNERLGDFMVNKYHIAIAEKLKKNFTHSFVWMMSNEAIGKDEFCVKYFLHYTQQKKLSIMLGPKLIFNGYDKDIDLFKYINEKSTNMRLSKDITELVDYESHIDNVSLDFRNINIIVK